MNDYKLEERRLALTKDFLFNIGRGIILTPSHLCEHYVSEEIALLSDVLEPWLDGINEKLENEGD